MTRSSNPTTDNTNEIAEILRRPYQRILIPDEDSSTFTAMIAEFPGCVAQGNTAGEAFENLEKTAAEWLESTLEQGLVVPNPLTANEFSGKVALRLPKWLHKQAVAAAQNESVSLNTFLVAAVAERLGRRETIMDVEKALQQWYGRIPAGTPIRFLSTHSSSGGGIQDWISVGTLHEGWTTMERASFGAIGRSVVLGLSQREAVVSDA